MKYSDMEKPAGIPEVPFLDRKQCLEYAMTTKNGTKLEEEIIERGSKSGTIGFLERWSRKKQVYKKKLK